MTKRLFDIFVSAAGLVVTAPVMAAAAVLVRAKLGRPVLFRQERPGLHGRLFTLYKFRTMTDARDAAGNLLPDHRRLTPFGRALRRTSIDELPELWNVLIGDMSLVGPRPLLAEYLPRYSPRQMRRHDLRPGITGWAQINGRNAVTWDEKFEMDVWYVDNHNLLLDLKILFLTLKHVLQRRGINEPGEATARKFMGSEGARAGRS